MSSANFLWQPAAMKQALDRMPGGGGSGSRAMMEITMDSSDFSDDHRKAN